MKMNVKIALIIACAIVMMPEALGMGKSGRPTTVQIDNALGPKPATKVPAVPKESLFATHAQVQQWSAAQAAQAHAAPAAQSHAAPAAQTPSKRQAGVVPSKTAAFVQMQIQNAPYYKALQIEPNPDQKQDMINIKNAYAHLNAAFGPRAPLPKAQNNPKGKRDRAAYMARVKMAYNILLKAHGQPTIK